MRVITGSARGRRLRSPVGEDVRPTTDTVKESVFSIIQFQVPGSVFLDAFAGSGQMGIEALSRGAGSAYFVDSSRASLKIIRENVALCGMEEQARIISSDTLSFLSAVKETFDIVFLDPPYRTGLLQQALEKAAGVTRPEGVIICEHPVDEALPEAVKGFQLKRKYKYGGIMLSVYTCEEVKEH